MTITKVTDRHIMFTVPENAEDGYVSMGLILGKKHNFIIDTGTGESNVRAMLEYIGDDSKPIVAIITHAHWDHFFGNSALKDETIVSHLLCREIMDKEWDTKTKERMIKNREFIDTEIHKCLPNLVFEGSLHFPEDGISLFHTPGHTDDGISVYDTVDKVLYAGDNFGVYDGIACWWTNHVKDAQRLLDIYKQYDFDICISSHSEPQTGEVIALLETALAKELCK